MSHPSKRVLTGIGCISEGNWTNPFSKWRLCGCLCVCVWCSLNTMAKVKFTAPPAVADTGIKWKGWKGETGCHAVAWSPYPVAPPAVWRITGWGSVTTWHTLRPHWLISISQEETVSASWCSGMVRLSFLWATDNGVFSPMLYPCLVHVLVQHDFPHQSSPFLFPTQSSADSLRSSELECDSWVVLSRCTSQTLQDQRQAVESQLWL